MTSTLTRPAPADGATTIRPIIAVHVGLLVVGALVVSLGEPAKGWGILALVIAYVVALQIACRRSGHADLASLAAFLVAVSFFQVLPDWALSDLVGTLRFPDTGGLRVDDVIPVAMAAMWVAPLFAAVALAGFRPARAALFSAIIFLGTEIMAPVLGLWEPTGDTHKLLGVAIYVIPAEAALGWATAVAFLATRDRSVPTKIAAALAVSTFYFGALVLAHFLIDIAGWSITA